MRRIVLSVVLSVWCLVGLFGQSITPIVHSYSPHQMGGGDTNWGICQSPDGRIYVGNRTGLMEFDGISWRQYRLPSAAQLVRSVYYDVTDSRVYVGAFEEFGYFSRNSFGLLEYRSLSDEMRHYKMLNDEIWNIIEWQGKIVFQSFSSFFVYDGKEVRPVRNGSELYLFFFKIDQDLYTYERVTPFARVDLFRNRLVSMGLKGLDSRVIGGFRGDGESYVLMTERSGIVRFDEATGSVVRIDQMGSNYPTANRTIELSNGDWVVGTTDQGVYCFDRSGVVKWHLDREGGLPNNTVQNLFEDLQGNLWIATEKGIAQIFTNSPFMIVSFPQQSIGSVFTSLIEGDRFYFGTNTGLFSAPKTNLTNWVRHGAFRNQVWELSRFGSQLFVGTNEHTYTIDQGRMEVVSTNDGGMSLQQAQINGQDILVQGTYSDLCIYRKGPSGRWTFSHQVPNFLQPIRHLEVDYQGNIWCAHLRKGLYKVSLSNELDRILTLDYYPSLNKELKGEELIYVNKIDNQVVFSNDSSFYIYNEHDKRIIPYTKLNDQLGAFRGAQRIIPAEKNHYWIIKRNAAALVHCEGERVVIRKSVNLTSFNSFFVENEQSIVPLGNGKHLFCLEQGFAYFDEHFESSAVYNPSIFVTEILMANARGEKKNVLLPSTNLIDIPYQTTSISIRCAYPDHTQGTVALLYYRLVKDRKVVIEGGLVGSVLTLSALSAGKYELLFYAMNDQGVETDRLSLAINKHEFVLFSPFAYLLYLVVTGIAIYLWMRYKQRRLMVKQFELQKALEREQKERIVQLENEKLNAELSFKGKELASYALNKTKQNQLLSEIAEELKEQKLSLGQQYPNKFYNKLLKLVEENLSTEADWKVFEQNFDLIHEHFFRNLRRDYAELTPGDLRLCGYLRLNLSTKEIAELMSISVKSVEVARYRLRKKLHLPDHQNLVDFMIGSH